MTVEKTHSSLTLLAEVTATNRAIFKVQSLTVVFSRGLKRFSSYSSPCRTTDKFQLGKNLKGAGLDLAMALKNLNINGSHDNCVSKKTDNAAICVFKVLNANPFSISS